MIPARLPRRSGGFASKRINRAPSPLLVRTVPWLTVMLASLLPAWPYIATAPLLPPLGFLVLIGWQQIRPGLLPIWAGLPLGVFDDIYSGQPFGSAVLLWSLAMIALDVLEARFPWRNFLLDWVAAAALIVIYILATMLFAGANVPLMAIAPQLLLAVFLYPLVGRAVALFDRFRLLPLARVR